MSKYPRGLEGVIANESSLSNVVGDVGKLSYLGYHIDDLVENCRYEEIIHLLHQGHLPDREELAAFEKNLRADRNLPDQVLNFLKNAPKDASPMDVLRTAVSMLGLYDPRAKIGEPDNHANAAVALSLCAKTATIVAAFNRFRNGLELPEIREDLTEAEHFLYLVNGEVPSDTAARTLDVALILHADHGMNASTFSARVTVATLSDMYSAVTAAIGTLKGPLHGGANEGVIHMLQDIGDLDQVDAFVEGKLQRKEKIMGIGHPRLQSPRSPRPTPPQTRHSPHRRTRRAQMDQNVRTHRGNHARAQRPRSQRRFLLRDRLLFPRNPHRPIHAHLRHLAHLRLDRPRPRAARGQPPLPPAHTLYRPGNPQSRPPCRRALRKSKPNRPRHVIRRPLPLSAALAIAIASCAPPQAVIVEDAPAEPRKTSAPAPPEQSRTTTPPADDGFRIGDDILALPGDDQLRSSPEVPAREDATLITRPPEE